MNVETTVNYLQNSHSSRILYGSGIDHLRLQLYSSLGVVGLPHYQARHLPDFHQLFLTFLEVPVDGFIHFANISLWFSEVQSPLRKVAVTCSDDPSPVVLLQDPKLQRFAT